MDRISQLKRFIEAKPDEPFPRYALALELRGQGDVEGAIRELQALVARNPHYVPSWLMLGMLLQSAGRTDEARAAFTAGQGHARAKGDTHALSELTSSLEALG